MERFMGAPLLVKSKRGVKRRSRNIPLLLHQGTLAADGAIVARLRMQQLAEIRRCRIQARVETVESYGLGSRPWIAKRAQFQLVPGAGHMLIQYQAIELVDHIVEQLLTSAKRERDARAS